MEVPGRVGRIGFPPRLDLDRHARVLVLRTSRTKSGEGPSAPAAECHQTSQQRSEAKVHAHVALVGLPDAGEEEESHARPLRDEVGRVRRHYGQRSGVGDGGASVWTRGGPSGEPDAAPVGHHLQGLALPEAEVSLADGAPGLLLLQGRKPVRLLPEGHGGGLRVGATDDRRHGGRGRSPEAACLEGGPRIALARARFRNRVRERHGWHGRGRVGGGAASEEAAGCAGGEPRGGRERGRLH
mmetsp:Transcript_10646/g.32547  ORF Transcript_10646/g.32547 Transcript_10646/m.32547 type:complete len:241 (-) Transcript_10646:122-844(-)